MNKSLPLTIIDDKNLRGVIAPSNVLSRELLEDVVDFIELSSPESVRATEARVKAADRIGSWIPAKEVERRLKKRMKSSE